MNGQLARSRQDGFVLAVTLWVLVAILISATFFASRVERAVNLAGDFRNAIDAEVEMASARADLLHRLATTPFTEFGLGDGTPESTIRLDDRHYKTGPLTEVGLQDGRGLVNLNLVGADTLALLLAPFGIDAREVDRLSDTLADYIDGDSLRRLNGAEAPEYLAAHLPPPRNAPLVSTAELRRVIAWRDHPALLEDRHFMDLLTVGNKFGINPNTAPYAVLLTLPNVTPDVAKAIIKTRDIRAFPSASVFAHLIAVEAAYAMTNINAFPSTNIRMTQMSPGRGWALRYDVELLPQGDIAPWRIERAMRIERLPDASAADNSSASGHTATPDLPQRSSDVVTNLSQ